MAWEKLEAGAVVVDGYTHVAVRRLTGRQALCGAGRIVVMISAGYDPAKQSACLRCAAEVATWDGAAPSAGQPSEDRSSVA